LTVDPQDVAALEVTSHHDEHSSWEMVSRAPDPRLPGVGRYCGYHEHSHTAKSRLEVPSGRCALILSFGDPIDVNGERRTSFVAGLHEHPAVTTFAGSQHGVQVDVTPQAARRLLGLPLSEVSTELVVGWDDLLGRAGDELIERLAGAPGWEERFALLDSELGRRLSDAAPVAHEREVGWAYGRLAATHGRAPVGALAGDLGWSPRRLIARFRDGIGLPPKLTGRILRFERVVARIGGGDSLADIAYDCGYYDQAHLNRDFREFALCTPGQYVARQLPEGGGVAAT
jgi:AraC-like DNA-binding protein